MRRPAAYLLAALLGGGTASACAVGLPMEPEALAGAEVVVVGRLVDATAEAVEVEVIETLAGQERERWEVQVLGYPFPTASFGWAEQPEAGEAAILGIRLPGEGVEPTPHPYGLTVTVPTLYGVPCAANSLIRDLPELRARVEAALEGRQ